MILEQAARGRLARERIVDLVRAPEFEQRGEVADALGGCGHGGDDTARGATRRHRFHPVEPEQEEGSIFPVVDLGNVHRTANRAAGVGEVQIRARSAGGVGEERIGVQRGGLFAEERGAMHFVGPGLEADVDHSAFGLTGGDVKGRRLHLEFGYDVRHRRPGLADGAARFVVEGVARAVEGELVAAGRRARHRVGCVERLPRLIFRRLVGECHTVAQADDVVHIAEMDGQIAHLFGSDHAAHGDIGTVEQRCVLGDRDGFGLHSHLERQVQLHAIVDAERDAALHQFLEASLLRLDPVVAGNQKRREVVPFRVGLCAHRYAGIDVGERDRRRRYHRTAGVGDAPDDACPGFLRPRDGHRKRNGNQNCKNEFTACKHGMPPFPRRFSKRV